MKHAEAATAFDNTFWYEGAELQDSRKGDKAACAKTWQKSGNVTDEEGTWKAAYLKKLPPLLKPYKDKLTKLGAKYTLVEAHFTFIGAAEEWAIYAARNDGDRVVLGAAVLAWKSTE